VYHAEADRHGNGHQQPHHHGPAHPDRHDALALPGLLLRCQHVVDLAQILDQLRSCLVAIARVLLQERTYHLQQRLGCIRVLRYQRRQWLIEYLSEQVADIGRLVRGAAREQPIKHHSQRVQVATAIDFHAAQGLGRHVMRGARNVAMLVGLPTGVGATLGDAKIHDLDVTRIAGANDVFQLDVLMDNALSVRIIQRIADLHRHLQDHA